jgi:hypothetical protein
MQSLKSTLYTVVLYKVLHSAKISKGDLRSKILTDSSFKSADLQCNYTKVTKHPAVPKDVQCRSTQVYQVLKYSISCVIMCCRMSFRALTFLEHC